MTTHLKCVRCYFRKPRTDFRETPWHGRAAACESCERFTYWDRLLARTQWELEQSRERTRGLRRGLRLVRTTPFRLFRQRYALGMSEEAVR
ncbi:hypothetical protein [Streptomyces sp. bgisy159]|uniref:hypothetical protein n=1 Tax=Streptomyces sp. bgisy159 TaxID=3413795 RepID=UPI003F49C402